MSQSPPRRHFANHLRNANSAYLPAGSADDSTHVAYVLLQHYSMTAFTASLDALATTNLVTKQPLFTFSTYSLQGTTVRSDLAIDVATSANLSALDAAHFDWLIICGGYRCDLREDPVLSRKLQQAQAAQRIIGATWNGAVSLAQAGLLDNATCALHPDNHALMREQFPRVTVCDQALSQSGNITTSAGPSSAMDMTTLLIRQQHTPNIARAVQEILNCDRDPDQTERSLRQVGNDPTYPASLQAALELMQNNIEEPLTMEELSDCIGVSRRSIERLFHRYLEVTPSRYYVQLRITRARQLLLQSNRPITDIAISCGFLSTTHFSHCFRQYFGSSPSEARRRRG